MTMSDDDLTLDGNGVAGLLTELLSADPTTLMRACASCGQRHPIGAHRAYRGAGVVLRCPSCGDAAVIIGVQEERLTLQTRGTFAVARPG
jgi:predicted RNA-binding Zn-ribbon protein involved in translation (DUF1610 family)